MIRYMVEHIYICVDWVEKLSIIDNRCYFRIENWRANDVSYPRNLTFLYVYIYIFFWLNFYSLLMNRCGSLDGNEFKRNFGQLPKRRFERKKKKKTNKKCNSYSRMYNERQPGDSSIKWKSHQSLIKNLIKIPPFLPSIISIR